MALLGCRAVPGPGLVYWNLTTNTLDHTVPNVPGVDGAIYNAKADRFFAGATRWPRAPGMATLAGGGTFLTNGPSTIRNPHVPIYRPTRGASATGAPPGR